MMVILPTLKGKKEDQEEKEEEEDSEDKNSVQVNQSIYPMRRR